MQKKKFNKVVYITLCVLLLFNLFPIKAYAHNAYYLQVLIDENTMTYAGNVVKDNAKKFGTENSHIGVKIYDSYDDNVNKFTFPPYEIGGEKFSHRAENDVSSKEIEKAFEIRDILIPTINDGILILNDGERPNTVEELQNLANMLSNKTIDSEGFIDVDGYKLKASIKKGYSDDAKINRGFSYSLSKDEDTITIKDIINQGNVAAEKGYYSANTEELNKPSSIEIKISNLITSFVNGLRSLLGLFSMNDLVYNQGIEDSDYEYIKRFRSSLQGNFENNLGWDLHVHKNGALIVLSDDNKVGDLFPSMKGESEAVLLFAKLIREKLEEGKLSLNLNDEIVLSIEDFNKLLLEVREKKGSGFKKELRDSKNEYFIEVLLNYMKEFLMLEKRGDSIVLLPVLGKVIGDYPKDYLANDN